MFGISKYAYLGAAAALAVSVAFGAWQYNRANGLQEAVATERANVQKVTEVNQNLINQMDNLQKIRDRQQAEILQLGGLLSDHEREKNEALAKLNDYRSRLAELAQQKPGLIGRFATRAVDDLMCEFIDASGGKSSSCGSKAVPSAASDSNSGATKNKD